MPVNEIRGEKVVFGKGDFHSLDAMPSAVQPDAVVLAVPRRRNWMRRAAKLALVAACLVLIVTGALFITLERGFLDQTLTTQAEKSLSSILGSEFKPKVGAIRLRFLDNWMLGLEAQGVEITHVESGILALKSDSIRTVLDPLALLSGKVKVLIAEIGSAEGDLRFLPASPAFDWRLARIDAVPGWLDLAYPALDGVVAMLERSGTETISAGSLLLHLPNGKSVPVVLKGTEFANGDDGKMAIRTSLQLGKIAPQVAIELAKGEGTVSGLDLIVSDLATEPFLFKYSKITGEKRYGLDAKARVHVSSRRQAQLVAKVEIADADFYADGDPQRVKQFKALASYDFARKKFEISDGMADFGATTIPFEGAVIDLDKSGKGEGVGFAFELAANDGMASAEFAGEAPEAFNGGISGFFRPDSRELQLDALSVMTPSGNLTGFLNARLVEPSPAVLFTARAEALSVRSVKQLWPFWFAKKTRHWVLENIAGGEITNGTIDVSLAAGRIPEHPEPLVFGENELHVAFDATGVGVRFLKEAPAARAVDGHFDLKDRALKIDIARGAATLASGKVLTAGKGVFSLADISRKPLIGKVDLRVAGEASAAAEFAGGKPFNAMAKMPFAPADLSGKVSGQVKAVFGLEKDQNPPPPLWAVALDLDRVSLAKPFDNRIVKTIVGKLSVDGDAARLKGKADIDGIGFDVAIVEPLVKSTDKARTWEIKAVLDSDDVARLAPSLRGYINGKMGLTLSRAENGQDAELSLTSASLNIPFMGWRKGPGIAAKATFRLQTADKQTKISNFSLEGEGFGARGEMLVDSQGLVSGKFSRVKFSSADNFALSIARKGKGTVISVTGDAIDARPFLDQVKSPAGQTGDKRTASNNTIKLKVDRLSGYNKQALNAADLTLSTVAGRMSTIQFSAVTASGQAFLINKPDDSGPMTISSGDAGAVARFADIYRNMNGGLLNITLKPKGDDGWRGSVDIRNFSLINEARLKSIVSTRTGEDGRSLSEAVKADIDTSSQKFRRGFARVLLDGPRIRIENGVVRGDQLGATFQGTVRDGDGRMDMTGTFMPAYGLNRLFGELPLIGVILGNGRDRGLLGITFKLEGPFDQPKLTVNPLSLIAPGVFRNIFEFE